MSLLKKSYYFISILLLLFVFSFNGIMYILSNGLIFKAVSESADTLSTVVQETRTPVSTATPSAVTPTPSSMPVVLNSPLPTPASPSPTPASPEPDTEPKSTPSAAITQASGKFSSSKANPYIAKTPSVTRGELANPFKNPVAKNNTIWLLPWFGSAEKIFGIGKTATVIDVDTGIFFYVKRTYGYNHADVETLTLTDTEIMKWIASGTWNWSRRAVIVQVDGLQIAASMSLMPHAGMDAFPANAEISQRSDGYGAGTNLDRIKKNGMDGHFDIHFYGSRTHDTDRVDEQHQEMVMKAYKKGGSLP